MTEVLMSCACRIKPWHLHSSLAGLGQWEELQEGQRIPGAASALRGVNRAVAMPADKGSSKSQPVAFKELLKMSVYHFLSPPASLWEVQQCRETSEHTWVAFAGKSFSSQSSPHKGKTKTKPPSSREIKCSSFDVLKPTQRQQEQAPLSCCDRHH